MAIIDLIGKNFISGDAKLIRIFEQFVKLLNELRKKELPSKITDLVNRSIEEINKTEYTGKDWSKFVKQKQAEILKLLKKECRIVTRNYYRSSWLPVVLGLSLISISISQFTQLAIPSIILPFMAGVPIGAGIGMLIGLLMDKKAYREGRQLDIEIQY